MRKRKTAQPAYARVCGWCVVGALALAGGGALLAGVPRAEPAVPQSRDQVVARALDDGEERIYILRAFQGRVALFAPGRDTPFEMTEIRVAGLPPADQASLREGLVLRGEAALRQTLEDFGS